MWTLDWQILNQKVKPKYNECMKWEQFGLIKWFISFFSSKNARTLQGLSMFTLANNWLKIATCKDLEINGILHVND